MELKWRFPDNGNGIETGLETGDIDIFKKDPIGSLAREICQNSIDAKRDGVEGPVRVDFKVFDIDRTKIPGVDGLTEQINECYRYKCNDAKEGEELSQIKSSIEAETITCLRISDFNTTGLVGISETHRDTPFYSLTKMSGTSLKKAGSGGSKGIGKAAAFVACIARTVFYSTCTMNNEKGYIGIAKLRSVPLSVDEYRMSVAEGYYGRDDNSFPIEGTLLNLDPNYQRGETDFGTDLYLIGFKKRLEWESDLIFKLLDSFMVAFIKGTLEVSVDEIVLDKNKISELLANSAMFPNRNEAELNMLRAQYELLTDKDVIVKNKDIQGYGTISVYVKGYSAGEAYRSTKNCSIVRYPYMKILNHSTSLLVPYSALCIIEQGELHERLRKIENAEHTDWSAERIELIEKKNEVKSILRSLKYNISRAVKESLQAEIKEKTDLEGAGAFLPSIEDNKLLSDAINKLEGAKERVQIGKVKVNEYSRKAGTTTDNPGLREVTGLGGGEPVPRNGKGSNSGKTSSGPELGDKPNNGVSRALLGGMRVRNLFNEDTNKFEMLFVSNYDENDCDIFINQIGDSGEKFKVQVQSASLNGMPCKIGKGGIIGVQLERNASYVIQYDVADKERFAAEVEIYANR